MYAIDITRPGPADVLAWTEQPDPQPRPGEVVVNVAAAGINRADLMQRQGFYPPPPGASEILGLECSGTISALGEGVQDWAVGQECCALLAGGGYAQRVAVPAEQLLPVPSGVDLVTAAALPEVACTVWSNVVMLGRLDAGEVLLVHGGSGGIGTHAIQLGAALGARVAVTASAARLELCRELGAEIVVDYRDEDFVTVVRERTGGHGADVILDNMGAKYLARNIDVLADDGRLMVIGFQGGGVAELDLRRLLARRGSVAAISLRGRPVRGKGGKAAIVAAVREHVWPLVEAGKVRPVVHSTLPMARAAEGHALFDEGGVVGKVLLTT